jgi:hypothetical protein
MADAYTYTSGNPVHIAEGEHGLNVCTSGGRTTTLRSLPEGKYHAAYEVLPDPDADPPPVATRHNDANDSDFNTIQTPATFEFICFGHSHRYPLEDYPRMAPLWRDRLLAEARILARSIQGDQAIAVEYVEGDGSLGAWMSKGIAGAIDFFKSRPIPDLSEYDKLQARVWQVSDSVKQARAADYQTLHEAGLKFMHIREEQRILTSKVHNRVEEFIDAAHLGEVAAKETESAAFWVLDLYGQAVAKDPASLFAYRFAVLMVRAGAHGWGSLLADNSARAAFREVADVVRTNLPPAATGLLLGFLKKGLPKDSGPAEAFAEQLISIQLFVIFFTIDFFVFERDNLAGEERAHPDRAYVSRIAEPLAEHIVSAIAATVGSAYLKNLPPPVRKRVECLTAVIPVMINSSIREVVGMIDHAKAEKRPFGDVFCSEGGWALVRIIRDVGKAALEGLIKGKMEKAHEADKKYYKALILSIYLRVAPVDGSRVQGRPDGPPVVAKLGRSGEPELPKPPDTESHWKSKVQRGKAGPDADGNIGIAKLQPTAGEGVTPDHSTTPPPPRAVRKKVVVTPKANRVSPDKHENLGSIGPLRNWKQIKARIKSGQLHKEPDLIQVRVHDKDGKLIDKWYEASEPGAAAAKSQAQAEQKALAWVDGMDLEPGSKVTLVRLTVAQLKYEEYTERARAAGNQPMPFNEWKEQYYDVVERGDRPGRPGKPEHKADVRRTLIDNPDADPNAQVGNRVPDAAGQPGQPMQIRDQTVTPEGNGRVLVESDHTVYDGTIPDSKARAQVRDMRAADPDATIVVTDCDDPDAEPIIYPPGRQPPPPGHLGSNPPIDVPYP